MDEPNYNMLSGILVKILYEKKIDVTKISYDWDIELDDSLTEVDINCL